MQRLCTGLPHERSYTGVALGKIHAPRMHILPKMRRRLHNKSHQTKNTLIWLIDPISNIKEFLLLFCLPEDVISSVESRFREIDREVGQATIYNALKRLETQKNRP